MYKEGKERSHNGKSPDYKDMKWEKENYIGEDLKRYSPKDKEIAPVIKEAPPLIKIDTNAMVRDGDENIEPLRLKVEMVTGSLFDRERFLSERIAEMKNNLELRKAIHREMVAEIEEEIRDKRDMISMTLENEDKRNLKMDISLLRKEKRNENVRFWKDVVELSLELRKSMEEHETEKKIMALFEGLGGQPE
jgi:hypothetical protein